MNEDFIKIVLKYLIDNKTGQWVDLSTVLQPLDNDRPAIRNLLDGLKRDGLIDVGINFKTVANQQSGKYLKLSLCGLQARITSKGEAYYKQTYLESQIISPDQTWWSKTKEFFTHTNNIIGTIVSVIFIGGLISTQLKTCQGKGDRQSQETKSVDSTVLQQVLQQPSNQDSTLHRSDSLDR
jgi:hypothetical protein